MKIMNNYYYARNPEIITDVSGKIIFLNITAKEKLKLKLGEDVSKVININEIKKLSMFSDKIYISKTLHKKYNEATITIYGSGINKSIRLVFRNSYNKSYEEIRRENDILSIANNIRLYNDRTEISLTDLSDKIKEAVVNEGHYLNIYVKENTIFQRESHLQALILCSIAMMNETSPTKPVDLYISKNEDNILEIKVIVRVEIPIRALGAQNVEKLFPWCALRISFIDNICERNNIDYAINLTDRSLRVVFKAKELKKETTILRFAPISISICQEFYSLLAPRENIKLNYDKLEEEQAE